MDQQQRGQEKPKSGGICDKTPLFASKWSGVRQLMFSADEAILVSVFESNTIHMWDATTGNRIQTMETHSTLPMNTLISNGIVSIAPCRLREIQLWRVDSGEHIQTIATGGSVFSAVLSYDSALALNLILAERPNCPRIIPPWSCQYPRCCHITRL